MPEIIQQTVEIFNNSSKDDIKRRDTDAVEDDKDNIPICVSIDRNDNTVSVETVVGRAFYLYCLRHVLGYTYKVLCTHKWEIVEASDDVVLPTSDNPVISVNFVNEKEYDFHGGWGIPGNMIIFPMTPRFVLVTIIGYTGSYEFMQKNQGWSLLIKHMIIEHASRHVFSVKQDHTIDTYRKRVVNKELYDEEKSIYYDWHRKQTETENSLKKRFIINDTSPAEILT